MRSGESLVPMTPDKLRQIFAEAQGPDFSAQICRGAAMGDLAPEAIERFRYAVAAKVGQRGAALPHVTSVCSPTPS
jgi:hypothetical protein